MNKVQYHQWLDYPMLVQVVNRQLHMMENLISESWNSKIEHLDQISEMHRVRAY